MIIGKPPELVLSLKTTIKDKIVAVTTGKLMTIKDIVFPMFNSPVGVKIATTIIKIGKNGVMTYNKAALYATILLFAFSDLNLKEAINKNKAVIKSDKYGRLGKFVFIHSVF